MIYSDYGNEETSMKIREIRFCGFRVGSNNWKSYLLPNFKNHNLIVLMLALCSHMVTTFHHLLNAIEDPFMRFTEFALRSNIYRNIVLSIEVPDLQCRRKWSLSLPTILTFMKFVSNLKNNILVLTFGGQPFLFGPNRWNVFTLSIKKYTTI